MVHLPLVDRFYKKSRALLHTMLLQIKNIWYTRLAVQFDYTRYIIESKPWLKGMSLLEGAPAAMLAPASTG